MLIAARNGFAAGGRVLSAKSYVQDGLVAMWDGIENAGWGVHDSNATTWKDLSGSIDLSIEKSSGIYKASFSNNSLYTATKNLNIAIHSPVQGLLYPRTVEIAFKRLYGSTGTFVLFATGDQVPGPRRLIQCTVNGKVRGTAVDAVYPICVIDVTKGNTVAFTYSSDTQVSASYANGVISSMTERTSWGMNSNYLGIATYNNSSYGFAGDIFAIRLYSRALTAAEIAASYAIDKARFNLPTS